MQEKFKGPNKEIQEITLREIIEKFNLWMTYLFSQRKKILITGFLGGILGVLFAWFQPIDYNAKITFVVEEGKTPGGGLGSLASLAGQFGVDVGGMGSSGLFSGDNIPLYLKSESLAREVLLSKFDSSSNKSVADVYAEVYELKKKWSKKAEIGKIDFKPRANGNYTRLQDSLVQLIIKDILKNQFAVSKTDKKAGFIEVNTTMENEELSKIYCERIVKVAVERYINVKTQRQKSTVDKLQARVDSVAALLSIKTSTSASLQTTSSTMDINPLYRTKTAVAVETTTRDKTMLSTIFASVVQNLELAKFTLSQETPVIQIVDSPGYPLKMEKVSKAKMGILFSLFSVALLIFYLEVAKQLKSGSKKEL